MSLQNNMSIMSEEQQQQTLIPAGLDANYNPIMTDSDRVVASGTPVRDVDWRHGPQEVRTGVHRRAAYGQRCGMVAQGEDQCNRCKSGKGVFASCVVNFVGGDMQAGGACMNCVWTSGNYRCSHQTSRQDSLPQWQLDYIASMTQSSAAQSSATTLGTGSDPTEVSPFSYSDLTAFHWPEQLTRAVVGDDWLGYWYYSPLTERPASELQREELLEIRDELVSTRSRIDYDLEQIVNQINMQGGN